MLQMILMYVSVYTYIYNITARRRAEDAGRDVSFRKCDTQHAAILYVGLVVVGLVEWCFQFSVAKRD